MRRALVLATLAACAEPAPTQWGHVHAAIIAPSCTTSACHSTLSSAGGLDMTDADSAYRALTGRACEDTTTPAGGYVDTADPGASYLSVLLRLDGPSGMPPNGRLADAEIARIEGWMKAGARCD